MVGKWTVGVKLKLGNQFCTWIKPNHDTPSSHWPPYCTRTSVSTNRGETPVILSASLTPTDSGRTSSTTTKESEGGTRKIEFPSYELEGLVGNGPIPELRQLQGRGRYGGTSRDLRLSCKHSSVPVRRNGSSSTPVRLSVPEEPEGVIDHSIWAMSINSSRVFCCSYRRPTHPSSPLTVLHRFEFSLWHETDPSTSFRRTSSTDHRLVGSLIGTSVTGSVQPMVKRCLSLQLPHLFPDTRSTLLALVWT